MSRKFLIQVDTREKNSPVAVALEGFSDIELRFSSLPTADYLLSEKAAVERKTADDFVSSIIDRRLFGQAAKMKAEFDRPIVILEGDPARVWSAISPEAVRGAISFLTVIEGLTVLQTGAPEETAALLRVMARHAQAGLEYEVGLRGPKPKAAAVYAEFLVEGLPGVGRQRARQLLEHFGTPGAVMAASPEQLTEVAGIGRKSAQQIWNALNTRYEPGS